MGDVVGEDGRAGQHAFKGAKNFAVENANFKSAGKNLTIYENCNIVGGTIVPVPPSGDYYEEIEQVDESKLLESKLYRWVVDWLMNSTVNFKTTHSDALSKRTTGTGLWFMQTDEYHQWIRNGLKILWGNGMPGAGKTVLSSIIIDHLQKEFSGKKNVAIIYAYCRYTESYSATQIYASWIRDLLEHEPMTFLHIRKALGIHQRQETRPSQAEMFDLLSSICSSFEKVYVVLDGLDEAMEDVRQELLEGLDSFPRNVHSLIMSRPLDLFKYLVPEAVYLDIEARNEDIELFVEKRIHQIPRLRMLLQGKDVVKNQLYAQIKEKSGGMFLVASLQIEALKGSMSVKSLLKSLESLPTGVDDLYRGTLARINAQGDEEADLAKRTILWIIHVLELLSIEQLQHALAISLDPEAFDADDLVRGELIVAVCCGLIAVDQASQKVRLIHYTASDFLKTQCPAWFAAPHTLLSSSCVVYLSAFDLEHVNVSQKSELDSFLEHQPLLHYAYNYWGQHARQSCKEAGLSSIVSDFVLQATGYPWTIKEHNKNLFDLLESEHICAFYGLTELLKTLSEDTKLTPNHKFNLLHMAAMAGHVDVAKEICSKYPKLTLNDDSLEGTPLLLASACNHEDMIEFMLSFSGETRLEINAKMGCGCSALSLAVDKNNKRIVTMLLSRQETDVNNRFCGYGTTPLAWASKQGHASLVTRLLSYPAIDVNVDADSSGTTALFEACNAENAHIVKLLLSHDRIDVNPHKNCGCNPLLLAAKNNRLSIVALLSSHPTINIHQRCTSFGTALSAAEGSNADSIRRLLLSNKNLYSNATDRDVDVSFNMAAKLGLRSVITGLITKYLSNSSSWETYRVKAETLVAAASNGHSMVAKMLFKYVNLNAEDEHRWTGLSAAAEAGRLDVVEVFLSQKDIQVNGGTSPALCIASRRGRTAVVRRLLRHSEIDVNGQDSEGYTPITVAAMEGHWDIVDIFLSRNDIAFDQGTSSPLIHACAKGNETIVRKLLSKHAIDINKKDASGRTAVTHAASNGHMSIYQMLASDPTIKINSGYPHPLQQAAAGGHEGILRSLLANPEVDPNQVDDQGWTALSKAAGEGVEGAVELLLALPEVDVNAGLPSALVQACKLSDAVKSSSVVKLLLRRLDIDVNARDNDIPKSVPLSLACQNGLRDTVELLLAHPDTDPNATSTCGCNALGWTMKERFPELASMILSCGRPVDVNVTCSGHDTTPLRTASTSGLFCDIIPLLLAVPDIDVNAQSIYSDCPLTLASSTNQPHAVTHLLSHSSLDLASSGHRALILAVENGHAEVVKIMLSCGAIDINQPTGNDGKGITPLGAACSRGFTDIIGLFLSLPQIDVTAGSPSPFLAACAGNHRDAVELLLSRDDVDPNIQNESGFTALAEACFNGSLGIASLLLSKPEVDVNAGKYPPLTVAAQGSRSAYIYRLLRHPDIDVNIQDWGGTTPRSTSGGCGSTCLVCYPRPSQSEFPLENRRTALAHAAIWSNLSAVKQLLSHPTIDASLDAAFVLATRRATPAVVDLFLAHDSVDVNARDSEGDTALLQCVKTLGRAEIAEKLLKRDDIDVNATGNNGYTPLIAAAVLRRNTVIDILLDHPDIDPSARCSKGNTALLSAAHLMHFDVVQKLISSSHSSDLDFDTPMRDCGCSVLVSASKTGDEELIRTIFSLTNQPLSLNTPDCEYNRTPLLWASSFGFHTLLPDLLSGPLINVNHQDKWGETALTLAARNGHEVVVWHLLPLPSININVRTTSGESALWLAFWHGHTSIARILASRTDIDLSVLEPSQVKSLWKSLPPLQDTDTTALVSSPCN